MSKDRVVDSLGKIDDDMIQSVEALRQKKKRPKTLATKEGYELPCFADPDCHVYATPSTIDSQTEAG